MCLSTVRAPSSTWLLLLDARAAPMSPSFWSSACAPASLLRRIYRRVVGPLLISCPRKREELQWPCLPLGRSLVLYVRVSLLGTVEERHTG